MPKIISKSKSPTDINAYRLLKESLKIATDIDLDLSTKDISCVIAAMDSGEKQRLKTMAAQEQRLVAIKDAAARWAKKKQK